LFPLKEQNGYTRIRRLVDDRALDGGGFDVFATTFVILEYRGERHVKE